MRCNRARPRTGRPTSLIRGIRGQASSGNQPNEATDDDNHRRRPPSELYSTPPTGPTGMLMQPWNPGPIKTGAPYMSRQLGWTASGRTRAPRIHDLRHRMVVRRIQAWHANGVDVDRKIIQLATYLGHVEVRNVYWYLSAVPELMSIVAGRFDDFAQQRGGN